MPGGHDFSTAEEITTATFRRPHVVLVGAGASKAALPAGDRNGVSVPLLRDVAADLGLAALFPPDLRALAGRDFEAAYSQFVERGSPAVGQIEARIASYFSALALPDEPNLYDYLNLCLRDKDAIFTFNWDPFLTQSQVRLAACGVSRLPRTFFLHGNVAVGFCRDHQVVGLAGGRCTECGRRLERAPLLFPVERKNYQDGALVERQWRAVGTYLQKCFMLTIFGYSAPATDVEAVTLLKAAWGDVERRAFEQTEIINRPGADHDQLAQTWEPFIHTHHYEIHDSFFDSFLAHHPRRSGEAWLEQYIEAKFIDEVQLPSDCRDLATLVDWFSPRLTAETHD